jgi:transcriptional regulator with XRE-family HTH domain
MQSAHKLGIKIRSHIQNSNFSVRELERKAGLKRSAISNILEGKVKRPSLDILRVIAKALNCSVSEFLEPEELEAPSPSEHNVDIFQRSISLPVTLPLLYETIEIVSVCFKNIDYNPSFDLFLDCVKKVYVYALGNGKNKIDPKFAEWVVDNLNNNDM